VGLGTAEWVKEALLRLPGYITSPFVFQKNGHHYSESYARKLWRMITSAMGIEISLYQGTRHSSITEAVERAGYDDLQEFVGHASRAMTKRYGKMNVKGLERVSRPKLPRGGITIFENRDLA
jgi:integrase